MWVLISMFQGKSKYIYLIIIHSDRACIDHKKYDPQREDHVIDRLYIKYTQFCFTVIKQSA